MSDELEEYQNDIKKIGDKLKSSILQQKFWKIALKKSYYVSDKHADVESETSVDKKLLELLKNKYPDI